MNKRIEELDALRGIAALLVAFFHFTMNRPDFNHFFKFGTTGVDLFFIISGFVIFMSLQHISKGVDFVINRVSRLYPTYWAAVTFTFLITVSYALATGSFNFVHDIFRYIGNLTMFQFYLKIGDLDGPYWTMIIEMIFYILILVLFQLKSLKYINIFGLAICSVTVIAVRFFWNLQSVEEIIKWIPLLQYTPLFFAGTVFFKLYTTKENLILNYAIILFCFFAQLLLFPYAGRSKGFIAQPEYNIMLIIYFALFILFVNNKLKFIVNRVTLFLGKISFALYLIHECVSTKFLIPFFYERLGVNFWVVIIFIDLPIVIGIASLITYKIEVPYSKKMKEKLRAAWSSPRQVFYNTVRQVVK